MSWARWFSALISLSLAFSSAGWAIHISWSNAVCVSLFLSVCLDVNQSGTNRNRCRPNLACTDQLLSQNPGRSRLLCWSRSLLPPPKKVGVNRHVEAHCVSQHVGCLLALMSCCGRLVVTIHQFLSALWIFAYRIVGEHILPILHENILKQYET